MILEMLWIIFSFFCLGIPVAYYLWMYKQAKKPFNFRINKEFEPTLSVIVASCNEERLIEKKLTNILEADYPKSLIDILIVDSSTDRTREIVKDFVAKNPSANITLIEEMSREGKGKALNKALKFATGELVVITDVDCVWNSDSLRNAVIYLADPQVGCVTGNKIGVSSHKTIATLSEDVYRDFYITLRIGESNVMSTPLFAGELAIYKRALMDKFEDDIGLDDAGTAMRIIKKGYRGIMAPDAVVYERTPHTLRARFKQKTRRAQHIVQFFKKYFGYGFGTRFGTILLAESYLHILNPLLLVPMVFLTFFMFVRYPILLVSALILLYPKARKLIIAYAENNLILLYALFKELTGEKQLIWDRVQEIRSETE